MTQSGITAVGTGATEIIIPLITPEIAGYSVTYDIQGAFPGVGMYISAYTTTTFTVKFVNPSTYVAANPVFAFSLAWKVKR